MTSLALQFLYAAALLGMRERSKATIQGAAVRCVDEVEAAL